MLSAIFCPCLENGTSGIQSDAESIRAITAKPAGKKLSVAPLLRPAGTDNTDFEVRLRALPSCSPARRSAGMPCLAPEGSQLLKIPDVMHNKFEVLKIEGDRKIFNYTIISYIL